MAGTCHGYDRDTYIQYKNLMNDYDTTWYIAYFEVSGSYRFIGPWYKYMIYYYIWDRVGFTKIIYGIELGSSS